MQFIDLRAQYRSIQAEVDAQRTPFLKAIRQLGEGFDVIATIGQKFRAFARREGGHDVGDRSSKTVTPPPPSSAFP